MIGKTTKILPILFLSLMISSACAPLISPELRKGVTEGLVPLQIVKDLETSKGKVVLWGGRIMRTVNKKEGTLIEVLQLPLDRNDRPKDVDTSEGRFLVLHPDYLDIAIYREGREITVIGEIQGVEKLPLGEMEYSYPYLKAKKIQLWEIRPNEVRVYHEFPSYLHWYWGSCWWGYPY